MNAMFKEIRHGEIEKIRARIAKNPAVVNEIYDGKAPKKDFGQSPLQVAIKIGAFEIAELLIDNGADVDFCEDPAIVSSRYNCQPVLDDAIIGALEPLLYGSQNIPVSEKYVKLVEKLLDAGANPEKKNIPFTFPNGYTPNGIPPFVLLISHANENLGRYSNDDPHSAELLEASKKALFGIIDLLKKHGADIDGALDGKWNDSTVRAEFLDDLVPKPDHSFVDNGHEIVIKGNVDRRAPIRVALKEYFGRS